MRISIILAAFSYISSLTFGQTPSGQPYFEVVSVKRAAADSGAPGSNVMRGGPGTADPSRITFASVTMRRLLMAAYGVEVDKILGPAWLDSERYSVDAKVQPGTTREQLKLMLQNLIVERFHAALHHEMKDFAGYELVVAKRGAKLRPSAQSAGPIPLQPGNRTLPLDANGFPQAPPGRYAAIFTETGITRLGFNAFSVADLVGVLGMPLGGLAGNMVAAATVVDKTGLTGKYDFTLEFRGFMGPGGAFPPAALDSPPPGAPNFFDALDTQLGLRLAERKVQQDVLVIDSINRIPVEN